MKVKLNLIVKLRNKAKDIWRRCKKRAM